MKTVYAIKKAIAFTVILSFSMIINSQSQTKNKPINLLDENLSYWYKWLGVPHTSVKGLPEGTIKGNGMDGTPLGMNDPKDVFKVVTINNEKVLKVSGEIYGGLTTKSAYTNYHLQLKYKWGSKKWAPRLDLPKDCGIMFHLTGTNEDGLWNVFMMGLELQIAEKTTGDLFLVANKDFSLRPFADVRVSDTKKWDSNAAFQLMGGYSPTLNNAVSRSQDFESDATKWTTVDLYTIGSSAVYLVNGHVVMALQNAGVQNADKSTTPLTKGKILLQSEGAEVFYKDITIQEITDFPNDIKKIAALAPTPGWKFGVSLWAFHTPSAEEKEKSKERFLTSSVSKQLDEAANTGLKYIEGFTFSKAGKEFNDSLVMNLSPSSIKKIDAMIKNKGLKMESIYATGGKTVKEWIRDFEIAKGLNAKYIAAEPAPDMLKTVDSLAGIYGIKVAIHNHWKAVSSFWNPDTLLIALKKYPNLGACPDLGHYPKSGINPVEAIKKLEGHIIALHLKDITAYNNPELKDVPLGAGIIDYPAVFEELKRQHFKGNIILESDIEDDENSSVNKAINQSIDYYNKLMNSDSIKKK